MAIIVQLWRNACQFNFFSVFFVVGFGHRFAPALWHMERLFINNIKITIKFITLFKAAVGLARGPTLVTWSDANGTFSMFILKQRFSKVRSEMALFQCSLRNGAFAKFVSIWRFSNDYAHVYQKWLVRPKRLHFLRERIGINSKTDWFFVRVSSAAEEPSFSARKIRHKLRHWTDSSLHLIVIRTFHLLRRRRGLGTLCRDYGTSAVMLSGSVGVLSYFVRRHHSSWPQHHLQTNTSFLETDFIIN